MLFSTPELWSGEVDHIDGEKTACSFSVSGCVVWPPCYIMHQQHSLECVPTASFALNSIAGLS